MSIKELFEDATRNNYLDLQALIMFLLFEKKTLSMDDDAKKLDLYFLEKHSERMNHELREYKQKMNMKYDPQVYEIGNGKETTYILAYSEKQARFIASEHLIKVDYIKVCEPDNLMSFNDRYMTFRTLIKNKKAGILGGY